MKTLTLISLSIATLAGAAFAEDKKPAQPPADNKKAPDAGAMMKPPEAPKPPTELNDLAKAMAGTWKCTGTADIAGAMQEVKATITHKPDLDNFWMQSTFKGAVGKLPPFKFTMFTTYDAASKKFWRTRVNGRGGHASESGTMTGAKISWEGDGRVMGNDFKTRETEE